MERKNADSRPKIEVVRVSSIERGCFRPLDGVQLRATYSHVRVGTYCPEPEASRPAIVRDSGKPPMIEQPRKFKKNLGPVSRLLRRRHHATCLATKSCDNIYSVNRTSNSLDWRLGRNANEQDLQSRQSNSLDWRVGRSVTFSSNRLHWRDATRSAEQLSRNAPVAGDHLQTPSTNKGSLQSSPTICPWVQVEYSNESVDGGKREESQESDASFQRELQLNELKKRMAGIPSTSQVTVKFARDKEERTHLPHPRIQVQEPDTDFSHCIHTVVHEECGGAGAGGGGGGGGRGEGGDIIVEKATKEEEEEEEGEEWRRRRHIARGGGGGEGARKPEEDKRNRRRSGGRGGGEVAGLEESPVTTVTSSLVPGAARSSSSSKRTRPVSLAVQPLNYQRLDPERSAIASPTAASLPTASVIVVIATAASTATDTTDITTTVTNANTATTATSTTGAATRHHPNMTSQESIGSCSLDVDRSASDRSENTVDSVSEKTLHSLNLSCNGEPTSAQENLANGSSKTLQKAHPTPDEKLNVSNGHGSSPEPEQLTVKKPSYLGLSCSISGYSGITRYDSKLREGFRSRDSSPGTRLIIRDTSPAAFRSNENLSVPSRHYPPKSQSISPLAMDRQNGFTNGLKEERKVETYMETTRSSMSMCQGFSEVDKGVSLRTTFPDVSPIRAHSSAKRSPGVVQMMSCSQQTKSFSTNYSATSPKSAKNSSSSSEKSIIQQLIERHNNAAIDDYFYKVSNNNNISAINANLFCRQARPDFRPQHPVVSPKKSTDGLEQVAKPLQRVIPVSRKIEQLNVNATLNQSESVAEAITSKHSTNIASISDQEPAVPKVALSVLESSKNSNVVAKQSQEEPESVKEKDGHYFLKLLRQETDRLLSLAASAEAELTVCDSTALPEEAAGKLRSAAGKARLLASKKMQQFEGLCKKNISQVPGEEFPTTNEDLAGFWDMVMLQVVQVNELFDQIEKLRNSDWQEVIPDEIKSTSTSHNGSTIKRRVIPIHKTKPTANSEANKKAREAREQARRQMLEERRRAMRTNGQSAESSVKIFAPEK